MTADYSGAGERVASCSASPSPIDVLLNAMPTAQHVPRAIIRWNYDSRRFTWVGEEIRWVDPPPEGEPVMSAKFSPSRSKTAPSELAGVGHSSTEWSIGA